MCWRQGLAPGFPETLHDAPIRRPCYGRENVTVSHQQLVTAADGTAGQVTAPGWDCRNAQRTLQRAWPALRRVRQSRQPTTSRSSNADGHVDEDASPRKRQSIPARRQSDSG